MPSIRYLYLLLLLALGANVSSVSQSLAQESDRRVLTLSKKVGEEIDQSERDKYGLFPAIENFFSAKIVRTESDSLLLHLVVQADGALTERRLPISPRSLTNLIGQIEFLEGKTKADLLTEVDEPRFRVSQEIVGHLGALFGGLFTLGLAHDFDTDISSRASFYLVWGIGSAFTSSLGVHAHGKFGRDIELFLPTFLGGLVGSGVGVLLFEGSLRLESAGLVVLGYFFIHPSLTAAGGIEGYNLAVKSRMSQAGSSLIDFSKDKAQIAFPSLAVEGCPGTGRFDQPDRMYKFGLLNYRF